MAVWPIDGDELLGIERLLDTDVVRQSKTASWLLDQVLHDIQAMPTLTPPNDPLTLEQLREMDGEPVYIISEFYHISEWNIPNGIGEIVIAYDVPCAGMKEVIPSIKFIDGKELAVEKYGSSWVAYRRPPEGEEDT